LLRNQRGLLFTSQTLAEVTKYFEDHSESDYLRTGGIAEETVELDAGPLEQFSHAIEPQLRQLGMPTELKKGVINLMQVHNSTKKEYLKKSGEAKCLVFCNL
jgi:mRNA turnover protein 4